MFDLVLSDDLSVFSFSEDPGFSQWLEETPTSRSVLPFPVGADHATATPVSDDDESMSDANFLTGITFHPVDEAEPNMTHQEPPSIEVLIAKLNRSMLRSARSRAIVSKTVFPDLRKKGHRNAVKKSTCTPTVHKTQRKPCKNSLHSNAQRGGGASCSFLKKLDDHKDNSICGFLRASKKW